MTTFNDLPADIIFVIALLLHPTDLYNLVLLASRYARIIKNRKIINYHLKEINEIDIHNNELKYFVLKHTNNKHGLYEKLYVNYRKYEQPIYEHERKHEQINYLNGKRHGLYKCWYYDGAYAQANYQNGIQHGLSEYWYSDGQKGSQVNYQNGIIDCLYELWFESGLKELQINYQNGKIHMYESWHFNGKKRDE